jgi:1-acyl-sn-glycerol-3-phosphate acyltransferase
LLLIGRLMGALRLVAMTLATFAFAVPAIAVALFDRGGPASSRIVAAWARTVLALAGVRVEVEGAELLPPEGAQLFVSTHQSMLDIPALFRLVPARTRFVAKRSLFRIPLFGQAIALLGFVPIDRDQRKAAVGALDRAGELARARRPVLVFPEGTRSKDGALLPFKRGAFELAVQQHLPVIPVACLGGAACLPSGAWSVRPGVMRLKVGPVLTPERDDYSDRAALAAETRRRIESLMRG